MTSSIWDRFLRAQNPRDTFSCLKTYLTNPQSSQIITPNIIKKLYALISGFDCSDAPQPSDKVFIELRCLAAAALGKVSEMQDYVSMLIKHGLLKVILSTFSEFIEHADKGRPFSYAHVSFLEQLVCLIQKITYITEMPNEDIASKVRLIELLLKACDVNNRNIYHFANSSSEALVKMTRGKVLIGQMHSLSNHQSSQNFEEVFSAFSIDWKNNIVLTNPGYSVDLFDTTDADDVCIREELLQAGSVWPSRHDDHEEDQEEDDWMDIQVTEVVNAGQFWAHVGDVQDTLHKIENTLQSWPVKKREPVMRRQLYQFVCIPPEYTSGRGHCRGQVVGHIMETEDQLLVFVLDYGDVLTVKSSDMFYLNAEMNLKGIGPQCVLCCIKAAVAPPISPRFVMTCVATLMNLCNELKLSDLVISSSNMKTLRNLYMCPDLDLKCQALKVISNMAHMSRKREFFTKQGMVEELVGLLKEHADIDGATDMLLCAVTCLSNVIYNNAAGQNVFRDVKGAAVLLQIVGGRSDGPLVRACFKLLCVYTGALSCQGLAESSSEDSMKKNVTSRQTRSRSRSRGQSEAPRSRSEASRSRNDASLVSLHRHRLHQDSSSDEEESAVNNKQTIRPTDKGDVDKSKVHIPVDVAAEYHLDNNKCYVKGACVAFRSDDLHELSNTRDISKVSGKAVGMIATAFLNSEKGGSLFFGIDTRGCVDGIVITRNERDEFRLGVDREMGWMHPCVLHDLFEVKYHPVVKVTSSNDATMRTLIEDTYVIEIEIKATSSHIYRTRDNVCFFRDGHKTIQVRTQDIQKLIHEREEVKHQKEIEKLIAQITDLEQHNQQAGAAQ